MLLLTILTGTAALTGCGAGGVSMEQADVDSTIVTGAVQNGDAVAPDEQTRSDEATVRNAISSADVESLKGAPIPWANAETGTRGTISSLVEEKHSDALCRRFTTSFERFDGVALYKGTACMMAPGSWKMQEFGAL